MTVTTGATINIAITTTTTASAIGRRDIKIFRSDLKEHGIGPGEQVA
jgi:hypothetical protein